MSDTIDPRFHDVRRAQRAIRRGILSAKAYDKYVQALPDVADKAMPVESEMESVELKEMTKDRKGRDDREE